MRLGKLPFAPEVRSRAVQMYWSSPTASCASVAAAIGCSEESVRRWVHRADEPRTAPFTVAGLITSLENLEQRLNHLEADIKELGARLDRLADASTASEFYALF